MVRPYCFSLEAFLRLPLPEWGVERLRAEICRGAPVAPRHADLGDRRAEASLCAFPGRARVRISAFRGPPGDHFREQIWLSPWEKLAPLAFPDTPLEVPW